MSNDDLVAQFVVLLAEVHARIEALDDGPVKARAKRLAAVGHGALEALQDHLAQNGVVTPYDGTNLPPKP